MAPLFFVVYWFTLTYHRHASLILVFVVNQWTTQQPVVNVDLTGKTVIVLGANTGLGFEATKHFATMNPGRLILACRSQSKGQAAVDKLKDATGYSKAELWIIDLADFESVKRLQVNHLSTSLLALLLLPAMIKTAQQHSTLPRLVVVSSGALYWVEFDKSVRENPDMLKTLGTRLIYLQEHAVQIFTYKAFQRLLRSRIERAPPAFDAVGSRHVSPGYCYSELRREFTGILAVVDWLMERVLAFSTEVGSRHICGRRSRGKSSPIPCAAKGAKAQDHLWEEMVQILSKVDPRITATVDKYLTRNIAV
ncbi:hypothetical protein B0H13DRAFT_2318584 [Mycena leptocephala]|nr:hypothetical protein B0H13DRAFT_2318584 [Mycena leptocephala]